jgi:hypothetical protein
LKGYVANRNRTLEHLYDNDIGNNIFLAGDSHQNWVCIIANLISTQLMYDRSRISFGLEPRNMTTKPVLEVLVSSSPEQLSALTVLVALSSLQPARLLVLESRRTLSFSGKRVTTEDTSFWM